VWIAENAESLLRQRRIDHSTDHHIVAVTVNVVIVTAALTTTTIGAISIPADAYVQTAHARTIASRLSSAARRDRTRH
jgi:hypothetical protein